MWTPFWAGSRSTCVDVGRDERLDVAVAHADGALHSGDSRPRKAEPHLGRGSLEVDPSADVASHRRKRYRRSLESRRSLKTLPPVWQCGQ